MSKTGNEIAKTGLYALVEAFIHMPNLNELNLEGEFRIASIGLSMAVTMSSRRK